MTDILSIKSFGAIEGAQTDNLGAINAALRWGGQPGREVIVPPGGWGYSDVLLADSVVLRLMPGAVLYALNYKRSAIVLKGKGSAVLGPTTDGAPPARLSGQALTPDLRQSAPESCRVIAQDASDFTVDHIMVDSCAGAGIRADRSTRGRFTWNTVIGALADSIHHTAQSSYIVTEDNVIENSGDDCISVVSYKGDGGVCHHIEARRNKARKGKARGMTVVGGSFITYEFNEVCDMPNSAGMLAAVEKNSSWTVYGLQSILYQRNTVMRCGNLTKQHSGIFVPVDAEAADDIRIIRNNVVQNDARVGVRLYSLAGVPLTNWRVEQNAVQATTPLQLPTSGGMMIPFTDGPVGVA